MSLGDPRRGCVLDLTRVCLDLHFGVYFPEMQAKTVIFDLTDPIRLPDELGACLRMRRRALGMGKSALAARAGKVREVVYRLEAGEDVTVSSLMAVLGALGLVLRVEPAGLPTAAEVARRFAEDDDGDDPPPA